MSAGHSPDKVKPSKDSDEDEQLAANAEEAGRRTQAEDAETRKNPRSTTPQRSRRKNQRPKSTIRRSEAERDKERRRALPHRFWSLGVGLLGTQRRSSRLAAHHRAARAGAAHGRRAIRHQCLESRDFRRPRKARCGDRLHAGADLLSAGGGERRARRRQRLLPHDHAAALAGLAFRSYPRRLAEERALLPAQPGQRRSSESGRPADRGSAGFDRCADRFRGRRHHGFALRHHLHRRALDHRRRADLLARRHRNHHSGLSGDRGRDLFGRLPAAP